MHWVQWCQGHFNSLINSDPQGFSFSPLVVRLSKGKAAEPRDLSCIPAKGVLVRLVCQPCGAKNVAVLSVRAASSQPAPASAYGQTSVWCRNSCCRPAWKYFFYHLFGWTRGKTTNPEIPCLEVGVKLVACLQLAEIKGQYVLNLLIMDVSQNSTPFLNKRSVWEGTSIFCEYFLFCINTVGLWRSSHMVIRTHLTLTWQRLLAP